MTANTIAGWTLNWICSNTIASRIRKALRWGMWAQRQMFPDWFGLHGSPTARLRKCQWQSTQLKRRGIREWNKSTTKFVNVSPASSCILNWSFSYWDSMGEWWAVACQYRLINWCIAGAIQLLAGYINFSHVRANSARMLLRSALSQNQVSIW